MRAVLTLIAAGAAWVPLAASAQTGVPLPSPMDVINLPKSDGGSPCGNRTNENPVEDEIEAAYARAGRCAAYDTQDWNAYASWVRMLDDEDEAPYGYEVSHRGRYYVGAYENVPSYFAYHDLRWWDGETRSGYAEIARYGDRIAPGLTPLTPSVAASVERPTEGACGATPDALAVRINRLLAPNGQCGLYTPDRYAAFKHEVPAAQHYAVNYVAWIADAPLLGASDAAAVDAQHLGPAD